MSETGVVDPAKNQAVLPHAEATYYDGLTLPDSYTQGGAKYAHDLLSKPGGADITGCQGTNTVTRYFSPSTSAGGH